MVDISRLLQDRIREQADRSAAKVDTGSKPALMWVVNVDPLRVTDGLGPAVKALRADSYTPVAGERVEVQKVGSKLLVRGKVV